MMIADKNWEDLEMNVSICIMIKRRKKRFRTGKIG